MRVATALSIADFADAARRRLPPDIHGYVSGGSEDHASLDAMYGSIRMHQERHYPGNVWGTALGNPDFAALARTTCGAHGETVERTQDFTQTLDRARQAGRPALIELRVSQER